MKRLPCLLLVGALAVVLFAGCCVGKPKSGNQADSDKETDKSGDKSADKTNSKEGPRTVPGALTAPAKLVADLPADSRPKNTSDTIRIERANDWLKVNAPGQQIAWDVLVGDVALQRTGEMRIYTVTLHYKFDDQKAYRYSLHGVEWTVYLGSSYPGSIAVVEIDENTADRMTGMKGKTVRVVATVEQASFGNGVLNVLASAFVIDGIRTGLPRAIHELKTADAAARKSAISTVLKYTTTATSKQAFPPVAEMLDDKDAEVRQAAIQAVLSLDNINPGTAKESLPTLKTLMKDKDENVRMIATGAVLMLEPTNADALKLIPGRASVEGKYKHLLRILHTPNDRANYKEFNDNGKNHFYADYQGHKNIPAGYWVWVAPYWYVWEAEDVKK